MGRKEVRGGRGGGEVRSQAYGGSGGDGGSDIDGVLQGDGGMLNCIFMEAVRLHMEAGRLR